MIAESFNNNLKRWATNLFPLNGRRSCNRSSNGAFVPVNASRLIAPIISAASKQLYIRCTAFTANDKMN
jgi:hypothetical protein